jgi:uncharacterized membrane protein YjjP (DUF1212 family)
VTAVFAVVVAFAMLLLIGGGVNNSMPVAILGFIILIGSLLVANAVGLEPFSGR